VSEQNMSEPEPSPLVDAQIELRDFPFLPLDVVRLRDSDLAIQATGEEFRAAVLLWCAAWHQVPAASLPDHDGTLAVYAGFGRGGDESWKRVRAGALRGFVRCSDGRLYHRLLADKANEAWEGKLRHRHRRECERIKKAAQRAHVDPVYPTFDEWKAHVAGTGSDRWEPPSGDVPAMSPGTNAGQQQGQDQGHNEGVPGDGDGDTPRDVPGDVPPLSPLYKGQGEGQGKGEGEGSNKSKSSLRSDSSSASPSTSGAAAGDQGQGQQPPGMADKEARREIRLTQVTRDAMAAYNAILAKPHGLLRAVSEVGFEKKRGYVRRCLTVASEICQRQYGSPHITPKFWEDYFRACLLDDFKSGRSGGGKGHDGWKPGFKYLTNPEVMVEVFEQATSEAEA
jgi:hypothetical protein